MTLAVYDPDAERRSLMMQQKCLCNGEQTGKPCKYYWSMIRKVLSQDPDVLRSGEKLRFCERWGGPNGGGEPLEFGDGTSDLAVACSNYTPAENKVYDASFEEYNPLTPAEIDAIRGDLGTGSAQATPASIDDAADDLETDSETTVDNDDSQEQQDDGIDDPQLD